jgi:hypothetical protein
VAGSGAGDGSVNVDPELRKRVEQIKSSPVQLYREAGDYSNRELVEGIVVSPDDIAAIEAVARAGLDVERLARALHVVFNHGYHGGGWDNGDGDLAGAVAAEYARPVMDDPAEAAHHRMVQPDHYQRWEREPR